MPVVIVAVVLVALVVSGLARGIRDWRADRKFQRSILIYDESRRERIRQGEDPRTIPTAEENLGLNGYGALVNRIKRVAWADPPPPPREAADPAPPPAVLPPAPAFIPSRTERKRPLEVVEPPPMPPHQPEVVQLLPPPQCESFGPAPPPVVLPPAPAVIMSRTERKRPLDVVETPRLLSPQPEATRQSPSRDGAIPMPAPVQEARRTEPGVSLDFDITYATEWGEVTERRIRVKRAYTEKGQVYVEAYCYLRRDQRTFRADRMIDVTGRDTGCPIDDPQRYFLGFADPEEVVSPEHELVMNKAKPGLTALIWIGRASGDLDVRTIESLVAHCGDRVRMGRGAANFDADLAERWMRDYRPTFDTASGGLARMKRGGAEWQLTFDRARDVAAIADSEKRGKRLTRLFRP